MFALVFPDDPNQSLRLKRFFLSAALYSIWVTMAVAGAAAGLIPIDAATVTGLMVGVAVTIVGFYALLRSGLNLRLKDPSLTFLQCVVGLTWLLAFMYFTPSLRDLTLSIYVTVILFGIFQLRTMEFFALSLIAFSGYMAVVGLNSVLRPENFDFWQEALRAGVLGSVLVWCAFFGAHVSTLRFKLRHRNEELQAVVKEVSRLAERDELTQAFNRRYVIKQLEKLKIGCDTSGGIFSVAILDIDHFKLVNDRFGHLAGDSVLCDFSARIRAELRAMDKLSPTGRSRSGELGRYGGEEFILIMPDTDRQGGYECAERIRERVGARPFVESVAVTVSGGVAEYRAGESTEDLLRRADRSLYRAKQLGRNMVITGDKAPSSLPGNLVVLAEVTKEHS